MLTFQLQLKSSSERSV